MTLSAVLRFAPLYARQAGVISDQQKALGAGGDGSIPARLRFGARVFSALSTWALENGITAADSMACRGYGTGKRSFYSFYKFKPSDTVFLVSGLCLTAACALPALFCDCRFGYYPGIKPPQMSAGLMISFSAFVLLSFLPIISDLVSMFVIGMTGKEFGAYLSYFTLMDDILFINPDSTQNVIGYSIFGISTIIFVIAAALVFRKEDIN